MTSMSEQHRNAAQPQQPQQFQQAEQKPEAQASAPQQSFTNHQHHVMSFGMVA